MQRLECMVADSGTLPLPGTRACWDLGRFLFSVDPTKPPKFGPEWGRHMWLMRALWFRSILFFTHMKFLSSLGGKHVKLCFSFFFEFRKISVQLSLQAGISRMKSAGNRAVGSQKPGSVAARRGLQAAGAINYFALFIRCTQRPLASKHICKCLQGKRKTNDSCHQSLQP